MTLYKIIEKNSKKITNKPKIMCGYLLRSKSSFFQSNENNHAEEQCIQKCFET